MKSFDEVEHFKGGVFGAHDQVRLIQFLEKVLDGVIGQENHVSIIVLPLIVKSLKVLDNTVHLRHWGFFPKASLFPISAIVLQLQVGLVVVLHFKFLICSQAIPRLNFSHKKLQYTFSLNNCS